MNTRTYLMCAGDGTRWSDGKMYPTIKYKQHAIIDGEPLIERACRLFDEPVVVARQKDMSRGRPYFHPEQPQRFIVDDLRNTACEWQGFDRIVFLLGDVLWTERAAAIVKSPQIAPFAFYGSAYQREIFAVSSSEGGLFGGLYQACTEVIEHNRTDPGRCLGKLWDLFRYLNLNRQVDEPNLYFIDIEDGTITDFDWQEQYFDFVNKRFNGKV